MGLFKRLTSVFSSSPEGGLATADAPVGSAAIIEPRIRSSVNGSASAILDHTDADEIDIDAMLDDTHDTEIARESTEHPEAADRTRAITRPMPRNKQELFEELQKNYHEVTELIRKVDTHLDREQKRSERVMQVVERIDSLVPVLHDLPRDLNAKAEELNEKLVTAVRENAGKGSAEMIAAIDRVTTEVKAGSGAQGELVHTMATFRESVGTLANRSAKGETLLAEIAESSERREKELTDLVAKSRRAQTVMVICTLAIVSVALAGVVLTVLLVV